MPDSGSMGILVYAFAVGALLVRLIVLALVVSYTQRDLALEEEERVAWPELPSHQS